jgi:hypothetical protein
MDAFNDDFRVPGKAKSKSYEVEYESLTHTAVEKLMQADIEHISGIFGVDVRLSFHFILGALVFMIKCRPARRRCCSATCLGTRSA